MREGPREASTRLPGPLSHLAPRNSQPLPVVLLLLPVRLPAALLVHLGRALDRDHLAQRLAGDGDGDQVVAGLHERALAAAAEAATAAASPPSPPSSAPWPGRRGRSSAGRR